MPPDGLCIEFTYTRGGMMTKYDLWTAIIRVVGKVALLGWNAELIGSITFPAMSNVEIRFISSINPPRYQTKSVIWTLAEVFDYYTEEGHYSNCFVKTQLGSGPTAQNLGVASIKSTLLTVPDLQTDSSVLSLPGLSTPRSASQNFTSFQAGPRGLSLVLRYVKNGVTFSDKGFFQLVLNTLVFAAQNDPKSAPCGLLRAYNQEENYTLSLGPTSDAARENLPWNYVIPALAYLPNEMLDQRQGGRWAELLGNIKLDGAYIGRVQIAEGDFRDHQPHSCGMATIDAGGGRVDNEGSLSQA